MDCMIAARPRVGRPTSCRFIRSVSFSDPFAIFERSRHFRSKVTFMARFFYDNMTQESRIRQYQREIERYIDGEQ